MSTEDTVEPAAPVDPDRTLHGLADVGRVFFSFPEITDPDRHRDYNLWHQFDHLPQNRALPGVRHGERWVRSPACRAASPAAPAAAGDPRGADLEAAHYMAMYWFADPVESSIEEWFELGARTGEVGRRPEVAWTRRPFMGFFEPVAGAVADGVRVGAGAVPLLPHAGVVLDVRRGVGQAADAEAWAGVPGVHGSWTFAGLGDAADLVLTLAWCAIDPVGVVDAVPAAPTGILRTPLAAIVPGEWDWFDPSR